ncbi:hypothetical protein Y032_0009g799 [Ancylostoma ceylanicum]|uniref:Galectin n=1 Tax=Ancylostoma ceylanicum TaxID=53326 RepID=A0A016VKQ5_9BILA|nr:hypothetical protein Y032_0009g799 [Ancylostoma ceylanicum]
MAYTDAQQLSSEIPKYTHFSKEIFKPKKQKCFIVPVNSFTVGDRIRIVVEPDYDTVRKFDIKLKNGNEVVLSFEADTQQSEDGIPDPKHVVFNTFYNGAWEKEEPTTGRHSFTTKEIYTIEFSPSGHHSVYVRVNGQNIHEFRERHNGFKVSTVEIGGNINIHSIHIP